MLWIDDQLKPEYEHVILCMLCVFQYEACYRHAPGEPLQTCAPGTVQTCWREI